MSDYEFWSLPGDDLLGGNGFDEKLDRKLRRQMLGAHICFGGGKGGSDAPDADPRIGEAALKQAQTGEQWLQFARDQFAIGNERQKGIDKLTNQVTGAQLESMRDSNARADEMWSRYQTVFKPEQDRYIREARDWDSAARQQQVAAEARSDVMRNAAGARQQEQRQMASMGISPTSGRYAGINRASNINTALAAAGAQNQARNQVRTQGLALQEGIANMGQGATSTSAQQVGLGLNSGNSATGNKNAANAQWQGNNAIMGQGFAGAMQGYAGQGSTLSNLYGNQLQGWQAQNQASSANSSGLMSGIGSIAGMAMSYFGGSSKDYKENKKPVDGALDAVKNMPVEKWDYKKGLYDEGTHVGPYAEDFQRETGLGDGKTINFIDSIGVTMKAVQELSEKVDRMDGGGKRKKRAVA